jgi:hypothetical protein
MQEYMLDHLQKEQALHQNEDDLLNRKEIAKFQAFLLRELPRFLG